jgi:hypothetical protein
MDRLFWTSKNVGPGGQKWGSRTPDFRGSWTPKSDPKSDPETGHFGVTFAPPDRGAMGGKKRGSRGAKKTPGRAKFCHSGCSKFHIYVVNVPQEGSWRPPRRPPLGLPWASPGGLPWNALWFPSDLPLISPLGASPGSLPWASPGPPRRPPREASRRPPGALGAPGEHSGGTFGSFFDPKMTPNHPEIDPRIDPKRGRIWGRFGVPIGG